MRFWQHTAVEWASFVCLLLVQFHLYFWPGPLSATLVAGAGFVAVAAGLTGVGPSRTCLDVPLTAYLGIGLVSAVMHGAILAWAATLAVVPLYYGLVFAVRDPFRLRLTLACTVICQVIVGTLAVYYHAAVDFWRVSTILYLAVSQWSGYPEVGFLQALAIPSAFAMVVAGPTRLARAVGLVVSASIASIALGLTSRGALVAVGAAYLAVTVVEITRFRRVRLSLVLAVAVAIAMGAWHWSPAFPDLARRSLAAGGALDDRREAVEAALRMARANPWFGVGPGHFRDRLAGTELARRAPDATVHAHNMYLHVAAEMGIPALLAFLWLWWSALRSLVRGFASNDRLDLVRLALFGGVVAFLVRGLTDHFLGGLETSFRFNVVLWTMFAMVASLDHLRKERATTAPRPLPNDPSAMPAA